jgi:hypothetical protein
MAGFLKYAGELSLGAMIHTPIINIVSEIQKLLGEDT